MNRYPTIAIYSILKSLIGLIHRNGISFGEFSTIAKHAFIKETERELISSGEKVTTSSLAIITGLTRKDVSALRKEAAPKSEINGQKNRAVRVIGGWAAEPGFCDSDGNPKILNISGSNDSFENLVQKYSGDIPYKAMLKELLRSKSVEIIDKEKVALIQAAYIPSDDENDKYRHLAEDVSHLISTIKHNIVSKEEPRYQRKVSYDGIPIEHIEEFKALANKENQKLLIKLNKWLVEHGVDNQDIKTKHTPIEVGVGVYYFESPSEGNEVKND